MTAVLQFLPWKHLSPIFNNILVLQWTLICIKICLELVNRLSSADRSRPTWTKPCIHMVLSSSLVFWPLYDTLDWTWRFNTIVPAALMIRFWYKGFICKDPDDVEVQALSRSSSPSELLWGPMQFTALLIYLGLYHFMSPRAAILIAAVGLGDSGAAPLIGEFFGRHVYQMPLAARKSMEGSVVGVFLGTVAGIYIFFYILGLDVLPLRLVLSYGAIAAIVEATCPGGLDNIIVSIILHFSIDRIDDLLKSND
jgi:CDP-diglyceride synthetase